MTTNTQLTPQAALVLDYLKTGRHLTNLVALTNLGIGSLTRRITELRNAGYAVKDQWGQDHFERRYKRYWMVKQEEAKDGEHGKS
jgi:hypothetical protein